MGTILDFDFPRAHQATIDLASKQLCLTNVEVSLPLMDPKPLPTEGRILVCVDRMMDIPLCSEWEIMAFMEETVGEGMWFLKEVTIKRVPKVVA